MRMAPHHFLGNAVDDIVEIKMSGFARHFSMKHHLEEEIAQVRELVERHVAYTDSALARRVLDAWEQMLPQFVKVMPRDYQRMLEATARARAEGLEGEEAVMAAFEANKNAVERVAGG